MNPEDPPFTPTPPSAPEVGSTTPRGSSGSRYGFSWMPPTAEALSRLLPQYRIERLIGQGGMGAVYQGVQLVLERPVAIKLLPAEYAQDPDFVGRFQREARTLARLPHPGIVAIYDSGSTSEGHLFFVMEFVDGSDVSQMIRDGTIDPAKALELTMQISEALRHAHSQGVIHRDIKPANILVTRAGRAKLADFGLARPVTDEHGTLVASNLIKGTPDYMAPEQRDGVADQRTDIYALGVLLYEMLTGRRPKGIFDPPSAKAEVDARLDEVVTRALQQDPERRYQEVGDLKSDLDRIRTTQLGATQPLGTKKRVAAPRSATAKPVLRWRRPVFAALAAALVIGAAIFWRPGERNAPPLPSVPAASATAPTAPVISSGPAAGLFGFPQAEARIVCDRPDLRVSVWNNEEYLYLQAVLWKAKDPAPTSAGRQWDVGDCSGVNLDLDADEKRTRNLDRDYALNPNSQRRGFYYSVALGDHSSTGIREDSKGRGGIRTADLPERKQVRVDSYLIPLAETSRKVGDKIRLAYWGHSLNGTVTSTAPGDTDAGYPRAEMSKYYEYVLTPGRKLDPAGVPDDRPESLPNVDTAPGGLSLQISEKPIPASSEQAVATVTPGTLLGLSVPMRPFQRRHTDGFAWHKETPYPQPLFSFNSQTLGEITGLALSRSGRQFYVNQINGMRIIVSGRGEPEKVFHTHSTYLREVALDDEENVYFSESTGAGGDGKIYRIPCRDGSDMGPPELFCPVPLAALRAAGTVSGFWAGNFALGRTAAGGLDTKTVYISSGNSIPAAIFRFTNKDGKWAPPEQIFYAKSSINGICVVSETEQYYTDSSKIYRFTAWKNPTVVLSPAVAAFRSLTLVPPVAPAKPAPTPTPTATTPEAGLLRIESTKPAIPATLAAGERFSLAIAYRNPGPGSVRIFARPYTKGVKTSGYGAHASSAYPSGSGSVEGWFQFQRPTEVDEVRVEMIDAATQEIVVQASLPIRAVWQGVRNDSATPPISRSTPPAPDSVKPGETLDLKFTAFDGREVDLAKLRGKVVLIDFWATWCGPCMAELPHVLETYRKYHDKGFEIIGISFDQDRAALERITKAKEMTWPQYFDGQGWKNLFGVRFGIHGIPTMWLVDKQGAIASRDARKDLAAQVEALLRN